MLETAVLDQKNLSAIRSDVGRTEVVENISVAYLNGLGFIFRR